MDNFYEHIDIIFDNLYEKFGLTDELIKYKSQLLTSYKNTRPYQHTYIHKNNTEKHFYIDECGCIRSK